RNADGAPPALGCAGDPGCSICKPAVSAVPAVRADGGHPCSVGLSAARRCIPEICSERAEPDAHQGPAALSLRRACTSRPFSDLRNMALRYLKQNAPRSYQGDSATAARVAELIAEIEASGEVGVRRLARELDGWTGEIVVAQEMLRQAETRIPESVKEDIQFAHTRVRDFA